MKKVGVLLIAFAIALPALAATKTVALDVKGWTCGSCAASTRIALKKLDGVENVKTDHEKKEAVVTYDDSKVTPQGLIQAVERVGYSATVKAEAVGVPATGTVPEKDTATDSLREANLHPEDVSFFEVPLECGAAANLGCGSAAKPILRELEQDDRVATARINRPGTVLAVAWKERNHAASGIPFVLSAFERNESEAVTLSGPAREAAVKEYKPEQWYGPAEVDRLSEREAEVIASRFVTRASLGLKPEVEKALTDSLTALLGKHLTSDDPLDRAIVGEEIEKAAGEYLNGTQMDQLREALEQGPMALPGEAK